MIGRRKFRLVSADARGGNLVPRVSTSIVVMEAEKRDPGNEVVVGEEHVTKS